MNGDFDFTETLYNGIAYRVAEFSHGNSANGTTKSYVPIYAVTKCIPEALSITPKSLLNCSRIDLGSYLAFYIKGVLSVGETDFLSEFSRHLGFQEAAPGIITPPGMRLNNAVHWIAPEHMMNQLCDIISPFIPKVVDGFVFANCLSHRLNVYQYLGSSHRFTPHLDGEWPGYYYDNYSHSVEILEGLTSKLSMLLYLTDHSYPSGSTRLFNGSSYHDISPEKGSCLFFRHGINSNSVLHSGEPLLSDIEEKIVVRINVMYTNP